MSTRREVPVVIKDFAGLNNRDGGDKVLANQFLKLQNLYPLTKGLLYKRNGSTYDLAPTDCYGVSRVDGLIRSYDDHLGAMTLYSCQPDATIVPAPTGELVLTEIADGDILIAGSTGVEISYSWVGLGGETGANASGKIKLTNATKGVRIALPAFPNGVRSANIFARCTLGDAHVVVSKYGFIGSVGNGETLDFKQGLASYACADDVLPSSGVVIHSSVGGSLTPGQYYVAVAWKTESSEEFTNFPVYSTVAVKTLGVVSLEPGDNAINVVSLSVSASTDGAKYLHVFVGKKDQATKHPMQWAGSVKHDGSILITSVREESNASCFLNLFYNSIPPGAANNLIRYGFFLKKDSAGNIKQIQFSRTDAALLYFQDKYGGIITGNMNPITFHGLSYSAPSMVTHDGLVFFTNGLNRLMKTDGVSLSINRYKGEFTIGKTAEPPVCTFVYKFKDYLVIGGGLCRNQVYFTNADDSTCWVSGGTGTSLQFITIGDPFGDGVTGLGVFSFTSGIDGPKSMLCAFKKSSSWGIASLSGGAPLEQLSGRVGTSSPHTIRHTPIGLIFLGSDGVLYMIRGSGEPYHVGGSVKPQFEHLVNDDSLMAKCTAAYHNGFFKINYPGVGSTDCDSQIWGDFRTEQGVPVTWSGPHTGINVGPQAAFTNAGDASDRIGALTDAVGVAKLDDTSTFQDLGTDITSVLETKIFRFSDELHEKLYSYVAVDAYYDSQFTHDLIHEAFVDEQYSQFVQSLSTGVATWDSSDWDDKLWGSSMYKLVCWPIAPTPLVGRTFQYRLTHTGSAQFIVAAIGFTFRPERRTLLV